MFKSVESIPVDDSFSVSGEPTFMVGTLANGSPIANSSTAVGFLFKSGSTIVTVAAELGAQSPEPSCSSVPSLLMILSCSESYIEMRLMQSRH